MSGSRPSWIVPAVSEQVAVARGGRQQQACAALLPLTGVDDPRVCWSAAAACVGWMCWTGWIGEASDMVERVVLRCGSLATELDLPAWRGFVTAVVAGHVYDHTELVPRLSAMAAALPADNVLAEQCSVQAAASVLDPRAGLPRAGLPRVGLAGTDPGRADAGLMAAASAAGAGRSAQAQQLLIEAAAQWRPETWFETTSLVPPLDPDLRDLVDPDVTAAWGMS